MCGSLEKRGDGDRETDRQTERETDRQRPTWIQGSFGLLRSRRTKKTKNLRKQAKLAQKGFMCPPDEPKF